MIYSQDRYSPLYVSPQFEKFDFEKLDSIRYKDQNWGTETLENGTKIFMEELKNQCVIEISPPNEYFYIKKIFHKNGKINGKGLGFNYVGFKKGVWYFYDKRGQLEKTVDYDAPFTFTFEQMLEFAKKEGVTFYKYPESRERSRSSRLTREYNEKTGECWWELEMEVRRPIEEFGNEYQVVFIKVDGKTGKEISHEYMDGERHIGKKKDY